MEITAKAKHIHMSPRKVRLVVDLVRGSKVDVALSQLKFNKKIATKPVTKLIESAIANAEHNYNLLRDNLFVKTIRVDEGVTMKRWMPKAHGRATPIRKRASHIYVTLAEIKDSGTLKARQQKLEEPIKLGAKPVEKEGVKVAKDEKNSKPADINEEKGAKTADPRSKTGRSGHAKVEGSNRGFVGKMFNRKSG
ncbi:50S ribosomal protein L22 [Candidatus Falkowbacteria bacterium]|nr:50S ribosomal protein L22 [Candidatus Falkowbacteria bacterium]